MDLLHANSIQILDRPVEGLGAAGDALIAIRELDLIAVVDTARRQVVWTWGPGEIQRPHHPTLLEDGNILIFDNGSIRKYSRVIELEPRSRAITWQYVAECAIVVLLAPEGRRREASQRKRPDHRIARRPRVRGHAATASLVWEFYNPDVDERLRRRAEIYRMTRLEPSFVAAVRSRAGPHAGDGR